MLRLTHFALILSVVIFLAIGCSGGGANPVLPGSDTGTPPAVDISQPVTPDEIPRIPALPDEEPTRQRVVWGVYNISFDPNTYEVTITPIRVGDKHYNVTGFVTPPACPDCIGITVEGYNPVGWVYDILVSLRNPTALTGYDVRGTLLVGDETDIRKLVNADEYTELFDSNIPPNRNPFKAFATTEPGRVFAPGKVHQLLYQISFPPPPKFNVLYVIDASWPGNQKEPFRIYNQSIDGLLDDLGLNSAEVEVYVQDWQGDVESVKLDVTPLGALDHLDLVHEAGDKWSAMITNDWGATEGEYELWIEAKSDDSAQILYDKLTVEVVPYGNEPPVWLTTTGVQALTPLSQSMEVSFGVAVDINIPVTYNIFYSETTPIDFGSASSINVPGAPGIAPGLDNSKTYYFAVRAMDSLLLEETNTVELFGCPNLPPVWDDTIGITGATPGDEQVEVTYGTATDVDAPVTYIVYYSDTTPINFTTASTVEDAAGSPTVVDELTNGQEYYFAVRVKDSLGLEDTNIVELSATPDPGNQPPVWVDTIGVQSVTPLSEAMLLGFGTATDPDTPVSYNIYYSETTPIDFGVAPNINVPTSPGLVPTLDNSKTYYFAVRAEDNLGMEETNTIELPGCPNLPPQWDTTVGAQSLTPLSESMQVSFGTASDPDLPVTYTVYYSETTPIDFGSAANANFASSPAVINSLDNSKTYYIAVRAEDGLGLEDDNTVELSASPNLPPTWVTTTGVQGLTPLSQMMRVDFGTASDPDTPVSYNVYYSETTPINFSAAPNINVPSSPGVIPSLDNSKTYYFAVRAEDTYGLEDTNSVELSGCPNLPPVWDSTVGATYAEPEDEQVTVSFGTATDPDAPVSYNVYYSDISPIDFGTAPKINAAASPVIISPLTNWQEYHFAVRAQDVYGLEDDNTIEMSATPSPCISDDDPPDTFIDAGCEDQYKGTTEIELTVSGADPDNCTSPEDLVYEWRKKEQADTWLENWSPAVSGPYIIIDGLYDGYWDVQVRAVDEALNKDATPAECSFAINLWAPCEGSVHSSYGGDLYPQPFSVIPRTVGFIESEMGAFIGQAVSQIGPTSIGMYSGDAAGSPVVGLKYGLYKTATVLNIDCGAVDERMLVVTEDAPHQLAVYDIKLILGSFPIIDAIDLDPGQSWAAVELDDNGDLWGIVRDTNNGITFELRHYAYLHVDDLYVDPAYNHTPLSTIDITAEVGTEDDIFDLVCLFELDKLYIYDVNGGGSGGSGCVNIYDISGTPVWEDAVVDIFSGDLDYESVTVTGGAIYGDIEIDHMEAGDERCRVLLYGRLISGDAELYRLDHELNIVDSHIYVTAYPNLSINTDTPASARNLIVPNGDHLGIYNAPADW